MSHRARVVAAVERFSRRRSPAGFWPIDVRHPHVTVAGSSLHCAGCGEEGRAPLPRAGGYTAIVESFLAAHRRCAGGRTA